MSHCITGALDPYAHMQVEHGFGGGVYAKQCLLPPGFVFDQHRHSFDHLSVLASGTARITVDGVTTEHTGPQMIIIKADKVHSVEPITPVLWYCIHKTDCTDPEDIDHELIEPGTD